MNHIVLRHFRGSKRFSEKQKFPPFFGEEMECVQIVIAFLTVCLHRKRHGTFSLSLSLLLAMSSPQPPSLSSSSLHTMSGGASIPCFISSPSCKQFEN